MMMANVYNKWLNINLLGINNRFLTQPPRLAHRNLTHIPLEKMAAIFQMTFSNALS